MKKRKSITDDQLTQAIRDLDIQPDKDFKEQLVKSMVSRYAFEQIEPPKSLTEKWLGKIILSLLVGSNACLLLIQSFREASVYLSIPILLFVGLFWWLILALKYRFMNELIQQ